MDESKREELTNITANEAVDELLKVGEGHSGDVDIDAMIRNSKYVWSSHDRISE